MAETSGFFDAVYDEEIGEYDLMYLAEQFASYFSLFIGNGVFISPTNQLKVHAGEGLTVTVEPGWAFIDGYWYHNDEQRILNIPPNDTTQIRTDSVKCRLDYANRSIHSLYFTSDTEVERSGNYHDLKLANIVVKAASVQILEADITDTRMNESVCGFVKSLMDVTSTEDLFSQYNAMFEIWFDNLKDSLGEDPATNLQAQIGFLQDLETEVKTDLVSAMNWLGSVRSLKTYTNVTQLGLTQDNTLDEIFDALPSGSQLVTMIQQGKNLGGTLPNSDTSELVVTKGNNERATAVLTSYVISARRINRCYGGVWTGWKILVTQDELDSRLDTKVTNNFTPNRVLGSTTAGEVAVTSITITELGYLDGVTSNIQTQFDNIGSVLNAAPTAQASVASNGVITSLSIPKGGKWIITGYASGHKVLLKTDNSVVYKHGTNPLVYASTLSAAITIKMANASGASQTIYADASQYYITAIRIG